jgi:hypothetical protein
MFSFPSSDLEDLTAWSPLTSSFWTQIYGAADQVQAFWTAFQAACLQIEDQLQEAIASIGIAQCPVFHYRSWAPWTLDPAQRQVQAAGIAYPVPAPAQNCALLVDTIGQPNQIWVRGTDFSLSLPWIIFRRDPISGTGPITLWAYAVEEDWSYLQNQFGWLVNLEGPSSENYRQVLQVLLHSAVRGGHPRALMRLLSACTDAPLAQGQETVQVVTQDRRGLLVITDQNVYRYAQAANPLVTVGQTVYADQPLTDVFQIWDLNRGVLPEGITSLTLDTDFLSYYSPTSALVLLSLGAPLFNWPGGPLTFVDQEVPLLVQTNVNGYTMVSWQLEGNPGDVTGFFQYMHQRGVNQGATLANYLDLRPVGARIGQPDATMLPKTINPLRWLVANVLRNCILIVLRPEAYGPGALTVDWKTLLRQIMGPATAFLIQET